MGIEVLLIAVITGISSAILGVFLVLRRMSMMTDAISHTVLLGIVLGWLAMSSIFGFADLNSPILIFGAVFMGLVTVVLTELLIKTNLMKEDAATGVIFPLLFAIAVTIISISIKDVHMDVDAVLLGKLEMASIEQLSFFGKDIGPKSLYIGILVLIFNIVFVLVFYKELKIVSFDSALASTLGIAPLIIHYLLMGLVSLTAVTSFSSVGSVLVVALMIGPPITALQLTKKLKSTIIISSGIAVFNSVVGYLIAILFDVTIAGVIATVTLLTFVFVLFFSKNGVVPVIFKRAKQRRIFGLLVLMSHIQNHQRTEEALEELSINQIGNELKWHSRILEKRMKLGMTNGYIIVKNEMLQLTQEGVFYHNKMIDELGN